MRGPRRRPPGLNWQVIVPVVSAALAAVALGMAVCAVVAVLGDGREAAAFALPAAVVLPLALAGLLLGRRLRQVPLRARDGYLAVSLAWVVAALAGAAPYVLADVVAEPGHAFVESMSGLTTTGATVFGELEPLPDAVLLWRSISQWLGGVGIVVLVVAVAPATGLATSRIFFAETSGMSERLTPRIAETAKVILSIYAGLTAVGVVAYLLAGMGAFDAVNHGMTTLATGGFSTRTASIGAFDSLAVELVTIGLMALAGVNLAFYYRAMRGRSLWPQAAEVRLYLGLLLTLTAVVTATLVLADDASDTWHGHLREAGFTVTSILSNTGYVTSDFDGWPDFARTLLLGAMVIGGCAGSTSGGVKVIRLQLLARIAGQEVERQLQPKAVQVLRSGGRAFPEDVRRGVLGFFALWILLCVAGTFALLASGLDLLTSASGAVAILSVAGPGFGQAGATEALTTLPDASLGVMTFLMLAGRLEIFTVLVLLTPAFWRPNVA